MATAVLSLKESSRELIVELARALQPYFPDLTGAWRERITEELALDARAIAALERLNLATGCSYFAHNDFSGFFENASYFGRRLAKLQVDTRAVARSLELYQQVCEPYISSLFGERRAEVLSALEMLSSATFITVSGAYFDTQSAASNALLDALEAELRATDTAALLHRVLEITIQTFGACVGRVRLRDETDRFVVAASAGLPDVMDTPLAVGEGFTGRIAASGEPELILDAPTSETVADTGLRDHAKSLWGVPLRSHGNVIGVLIIGFDKPFEWLPTERELLQAIADRSALAIDRARMTDALREREMRIAELSAHLLRAQEEERKRISRELHDETGQALMVIRLYLGMLEEQVSDKAPKTKIHETVQVVDQTIEGIRRIIGSLSPLVLQELGLLAALRKLAKDLSKNTGIKSRIVIPDKVGRLGPETEMAIYRVVQEALHNVAKHSQAKSVLIQIAREANLVRVLVEDDGVGLAGKSRDSRGHSFGLAGIKERIGMLGGAMRLASAKGKGTRLEITVPITAAAERAARQSAAARAGSGGAGANYRVN